MNAAAGDAPIGVVLLCWCRRTPEPRRQAVGEYVKLLHIHMFRKLLTDLFESPRPAKRPYVPDISVSEDGRCEQRFTATELDVTTEPFSSIALSDLVGDGAVHGLFVSVDASAEQDPASVYLEYNDQGNACTGRDFSVQLRDDAIIFLFDPRAEMFSGRLSYDAEADPYLEPETEVDFPLSRLVIKLQTDSETRARIGEAARALAAFGVRVDAGTPDS